MSRSSRRNRADSAPAAIPSTAVSTPPRRVVGNYSTISEYLGFHRVSLAEGLGAIAAGTHEGTWLRDNETLYVAPHHPGEIVNPNAVFLGALVEHGNISPPGGGQHFPDAASLDAWLAAGGEVSAVFMTDSLKASQPAVFSPNPAESR